MTRAEALNILGDRPKWELQNMHKALNIMPILNTEEENLRLRAVKKLLRKKQ